MKTALECVLTVVAAYLAIGLIFATYTSFIEGRSWQLYMGQRKIRGPLTVWVWIKEGDYPHETTARCVTLFVVEFIGMLILWVLPSWRELTRQTRRELKDRLARGPLAG